ncbi:MAG: Rieske (2Fe-2S) protein [Rubrobacter sp.]
MEEDLKQSPIRPSSFTRGRFMNLGLAMGTGTAFVACSSDSAPSTGGSPDSSAPSAPEETSSGSNEPASSSEAIVATSEVPVGESYEFEDGGQSAVLVHQENDEFVAYSAVCTHQGCTVAYRDTELVCPCHGSAFDLANGEPTAGPANSPLPRIAVEVQGDDVVRA